MSVVMLGLHRLLPRREPQPLPPEQLAGTLASRVTDHPIQPNMRRALTLPLHFGFGALSGAIYGLSAGRLGVPPLASAVPYALLVWLVSYMGWIPAAHLLPPATDQPARRNAIMIVAHVVWGVSAGSNFARLSNR
jgi:uncharacterized membrane protein YagU involved in acid resistance